jgi:hypothetical protein
MGKGRGARGEVRTVDVGGGSCTVYGCLLYMSLVHNFIQRASLLEGNTSEHLEGGI